MIPRNYPDAARVRGANFGELSRCAGPSFLEADSPMDNDSSVSAPPRRMPRRCFGKRKKATVFLVPRAPFLRIPRVRTDKPDLHADLRAGSNRLISDRFGPWSVSLSLACYTGSLPVPFVYRSRGESFPSLLAFSILFHGPR